MTSFVPASFPVEHQGVGRVVSGFAAIRHAVRHTKSLGTLLVAAIVALLVVEGDLIVRLWSE
jgi:hypothetical protein